jgi:hypothetical protein
MPLGQSATDEGAPTDTNNIDLSGDTAVDEFFKRLTPTDAERPSGSEDTKTGKQPVKDESADAATDDPAKTPAEKPEGDAESAEAGEAEETDDKSKDKGEKKFADDGAYIKIKVGDEEHEVPVKDLGRLFGQEKALTQKSMEVAEQRKAVDAEMAKNVAASTVMLERAKARFEPYSKIDFLLAAKQLSPEDYTSLRDAAKAAHEDMTFLQNNLNGFVQAAQQRQHESLITQAKEALKVLAGPTEKGGIEGWNEKLYEDVRSFAVTSGLSKQIVDNLVDPVAISLLHDAMLYRRGKSKVVTTKVNKTPTKVVKTTEAPDAGAPGDKTNVKKALNKLQKSGSTDDAADAFMAGWAGRDAEQQ